MTNHRTPTETDRDYLMRKSHECRGAAERATTLQERARWIRMADAFLQHALNLEAGE